ncbi:DMT family transporter [Candidatus Marimicrobium litorale]|uniref:DMT family transporter n=1 Tax=Candidatus Marimicrobium litorale TaxID=2518991 RepID=A0ABT3TA75_9GAMM|nr:DMT family transporter [Candidatus Marimicrobium litorale]MCX2978721.1 DMT family transporter [Candidatus Marimicrobium litorale]
MQAPQTKHWLLLGTLSLAWGFAFYLIAVALESFQPLTIVNIRLAVGATTLYWVMRWKGHRFPREGHWWGRFALLTLLGNLIPFSLITWAETEISSSQAGLLMALMPISTMVLSHFFVHGDTLTPRRLFGVFLGFGGVVVLVGGEALEGMGGSALLAQLAVLLATLAYASNAVHAKRLPPIDTIVVSTGSLGVGALMLLPFTLYLEPPAAIMPSLDALGATLTLGIVSTGLATWMYFRVVTDCGPSFLSIINYIIPAIAFAAGVLFLNESAQPSQFAGLLLILAGIALTQNRPPARPA